MSGTELLDVLREQERIKHEAEMVELAVIGTLEARGVAYDLGAKNTAVLLRQVLNIGARDAAGRVQAGGGGDAAAHPDRRAGRAGASADRGRVGGRGDLDPARGHGCGDDGQDRRRALSTRRRRCSRPRCWTSPATTTPTLLGRFAHGLYARVDQDGAFRDLEAAHRRREVRLHRRPDGSGTIAGELTCESAEYLETLFDTLAKPHQGPDGERDPRTPGQRRHDALLGGFKILYSSGSLPTANGCATTLVLTATVDEFAHGAGSGIVQTAHGYAIPDRGRRPVARPQSQSHPGAAVQDQDDRGVFGTAQTVHRTTTTRHVRPRQRL